MKDFRYVYPASLDDAVALTDKQAWGAVKRRFIAGGQDLYAELKTGTATAENVVNLKALEDDNLRAIAPDHGLVANNKPVSNLWLGSLVTLGELEHLGSARGRVLDFATSSLDPVLTMLREAAGSIASPQIRSQATLGGNLCQRPRCLYYRRPELVCMKKGGDECFARDGHNKYNAILGGGPSYIVHPSDMAPALIALDALVEVRGAGTGPSATRALPLADFYTLPESSDVTRETVLAPHEVVTGVWTRLAAGYDWRTTYVKFQEREGFDFALSSVALSVGYQGDRVEAARLVLGGVAPKPWVCEQAAERLLGARRDLAAGSVEKLAREVGEAALRGADPLEMNAYKVPLTKGLIHQALDRLLD